jgi:hypothetical protein
MPSTYTTRLRLNLQSPGDSLNTWGSVLNSSVFQLLEDATAKRAAFALSGTKTLTTANGSDDEARCAFLDVTSGSGGTITIPAVEKVYLVRNGTSGDVLVTTGGGVTAKVKVGETVFTVCDASNVRRVQATDMAESRLTGVGTPITNTDAATKAYVDAQAFGGAELPGQGPGTVGQFVQSDGTTASWASPTVSDVIGAAPSNAPAFTGGVSVAGGIDVAGATKATATAIGSTSINVASSDFFSKSISANTTFTFDSAASGKTQVFILEITISSAAVPTWPASVDWPGGVAPVLGNGKHVLGFMTLDGGTNWTGFVGGIAFS